MRRIRISAIIIAVFIGLCSVQPAFAHASLVSSNPKDGATLDALPQAVTLVFNEELSEQSGFTIVDASGTTVGEGKLDLNDLDRKTLGGSLSGAAASGVYTVTWVAMSADDDNREEGSIRFTLALAQPTAPPTATATAAPTIAPTVEATAEPTATIVPTTTPAPTIMVVNSPTSPDGPTPVNDTGAATGRTVALAAGVVTLIGLVVALAVTRRRGGQ